MKFMMMTMTTKTIKRLFTICLLTTVSFIMACSSLSYPECVNEHSKQVMIRWGGLVLDKGSFQGYELDAMGRLYELSQEKSGAEEVKKMLGTIPGDKYCMIYTMLKKEILKTHTLNSVVNNARIIEYRDPEQGTRIGGMWNPKYDTKGSVGYREIWDSLQVVIPLAE